MSRTIDAAYQKKIDEIAEKDVFWFGGKREGQDLDEMLAFVLAKQPWAEKKVREELGITDDDFRRALKKAEPGLFMWEVQWVEANERFGFDPPLPFPVLDWHKINKEIDESLQEAKSTNIGDSAEEQHTEA